MHAAANPPLVRAVGHLLRRAAKAINRAGVSLQGQEAYVERRECACPRRPREADVVAAAQGCRHATERRQRGSCSRRGRRPRRACVGPHAPNCVSSSASVRPPSFSPRAVVPSTRIVKVKGKDVQHGYQNFVASSASLVGDVRIGEMSSAWYGATLRGASQPPAAVCWALAAMMRLLPASRFRRRHCFPPLASRPSPRPPPPHFPPPPQQLQATATA